VERTALVTDALSPAREGEEPSLYGERLELRDGAWYTREGVLAGSAVGMCDVVRTASGLAGVSPLDAVRMATATPARAIGLEGAIGALVPGARGDVAVCERDFRPWKVFVGGRLVYEAA
jgi:N-acetylglucosamine-6-phosphate deacetylase